VQLVMCEVVQRKGAAGDV
jgi:hypothetical protein